MADHASRIGLWSLLTSFHGRISRKQWWIGTIICSIGGLISMWLLNPESLTADKPLPPNLRELWGLIWSVPSTAISVKRFNDRQWPWWFGYALSTILVVTAVSPHFGILIGPYSRDAGAIVFWALTIVLPIAVIDNGFLRGTRGPNRYGPDPLASDIAETES